MFLDFVNVMVAFVEANAVLVATIIALTEAGKRLLKMQVWYKNWMAWAVAGVLSVLLAIPSGGFVDLRVLDFIASVVGLFLMATGLYNAFQSAQRSQLDTDAADEARAEQ